MAGNCTPALCRGAGSYIVRRQAGCSDPCCLKLILKRPSNRLLFGKHHSSLILQPLMIRCGAIINFLMNSGASLSGPKAVWRVGGGEGLIKCKPLNISLTFMLQTESV